MRTTFSLILYGFPLILAMNFVICYFFPYNYPTSNPQDSWRIYLGEGAPVYSHSATFFDAPINTKQEIEILINSLIEIDTKCNEEIFLHNSSTSFTFNNSRFLSIENIFGLEVIFDGEPLECYFCEYKNFTYYELENYTLSENEKIYRLEISFKFKPNLLNDELVNVPWFFTENYSKKILYPLFNVGVQTNKTSELCVISVDLNLPLRRILKNQSGWMARFFTIPYGWNEEQTYVVVVNLESNPPTVDTFDVPGIAFNHPIEQESESEQSQYFFSTKFSEDNLADLISFTLVPDFWVSVIPLFFFCLPCAINLFELVFRHEKETKISRITEATSKRKKEMVKAIGTRYFFPLLSLVGFVVNGNVLFAFYLLWEIMNPIMFGLMWIFPLLFAIESTLS